MTVLEMLENLCLSVLLVVCAFLSGTLTGTFVSVMKQHNLDANSLQFDCIKTNFSSSKFDYHGHMCVCFIAVEAKKNGMQICCTKYK